MTRWAPFGPYQLPRVVEHGGFRIGDVVRFIDVFQDPIWGYRGEWLIIGFNSTNTGNPKAPARVELDRWPRDGTYTSVDIYYVVFVRPSGLDPNKIGHAL